MRYLLNSAVLTSFGEFSYSSLSNEQAVSWANKASFRSTIGYEETANALSLILGIPIPVDRSIINMDQGDEALVFRLVFPKGSTRIDPKDKGALSVHILNKNYELGLLVRTK